ncbi:MAG: hypothetical protein NTY46_00300 [Candidatus Sumerlaeota bacterium]|nr:hypothetical protein [Candidatus Sumerlaeota bacterium]
MLRSALIVFFSFLALYLATAGGHLYSPDEEIMFRVTESLAVRGSLAIEPITDAGGGTFATRRGRNGGEYAQYGILNSLLAVPLYYAGEMAARFVPGRTAARALDFETVNYLPARLEFENPDAALKSYPPEIANARGAALVKRFAVSFFGAFVAAATCALLWRFIFVLYRARLAEESKKDAARIAALAVIAYGAGTMAWPHARTFFSEPLAAFFVLLAFHWLNRAFTPSATAPRTRPGLVFASGAAFALALAARLDSLFVLPALALFFALRYVEIRTGDLRTALDAPLRKTAVCLMTPPLRIIAAALLFALPLVIFFVFQLIMNYLMYGAFLSSAYADQPEGIQFTTPLLAGLYGFLFSAGKSALLFSPVIVLGLLGFKRFWRRDPALAVSSVAAILLIVLPHSMWQNWSGGWCWGPRHIFMAHMFAVLPVAGFVEDFIRARRAGYALIVAVAAGVQLYGCSQNFIDFYYLYYQTPWKAPQAAALYSPQDAVTRVTRIGQMTPQDNWSPISIFQLTAPINDSVYVPQNTQWPRYAEMWKLGYRDNLWLRLLARAHDDEPGVK